MFCSGLFLSVGLLATVAVAQDPTAAVEEPAVAVEKPTAVKKMRYVENNNAVPVRRGQGKDYKIIKWIRGGDQVQILKENEKWIQIQTQKGATGWLNTSYIAKVAPPIKRVKLLLAENEQLKEKNSTLAEELTVLKDVKMSTGGELSACIARRDTIKSDFQALQADTQDVVAIQNKMSATTKIIEDVRAVLADVQQENKELKRNTAVTWFLVGSGVFLFAWFLGLLTGKSSRKKRGGLM